MDIDGAVAYAHQRLQQGLDPKRVYHNLWHTFDEVVPAAMHLAKLCNIGAHEQQLLHVAAAFHDTGYIIQAQEHEAISVGIASTILPQFGFEADDIEWIGRIIQATRIPQSPTCKLGEILADADLDVLGRDDFWQRHDAIRTEMSSFGTEMDDGPWYDFQLEVLETHAYFTEQARQLRSAKKQTNLAEVMARRKLCKS